MWGGRGEGGGDLEHEGSPLHRIADCVLPRSAPPSLTGVALITAGFTVTSP